MLAQEHYALPIQQIQEIIRYTPPRSVASSRAEVCGVLSLRGKIVTVHDLAARLGKSSQITDPSRIMIIEAAKRSD